MDRYTRVEKPRMEEAITENEVRITTQGKMRNYITYTTTAFQEKGVQEIVLKAMGRAINKTVTIAEIIKRRIPGLHQITSIGSTDITDVWEPLEEGLRQLETTRHVSTITITLSTKELDKNATGYQPPLPEDQVKPYTDMEGFDDDAYPRTRGRGRSGGFRGANGNNTMGGRGRGGFQGLDHSVQDYVPTGVDAVPKYYTGRGQGRGRGRSNNNRGRGQYYQGAVGHSMMIPGLVAAM
eukprot:TRINITY_DN17065_c0_g1_i1.p1 TRINITY_DN17065_c0_g1~~TRINITY_DN17065_c0_g1_i1.p1  ORF type:complete len:238 (+),score=38.33 TRINITY_DN17065_c0_g1_i1:151-864(+)